MCLNISDIIATSSAVIALCSFVVSFVTLRSMKKYNTLSVMPLCSIQISDYEDELALYIANTGNGPLIIKDISFKKPDKTVNKNILELLPVAVYSDFTTEFKDISILQNAPMIIFSIEHEDEIKKYKNEIRSILKDITVTVEYVDIYGNKFKSERELSFFGRHSDAEY